MIAKSGSVFRTFRKPLVGLMVAIGVFSASSAGEESTGSEYIQATSVREFVQKLRQSEEFSRIKLQDKDRPILYIYEGNEREYEAVGTTPPLPEGVQGFNNQTRVELRKVIHTKDLKVSKDAADKIMALSDAFASNGILVKSDMETARFSVHDSWTLDSAAWPLTWDLDETAGRSMTFDEAVEFLIKNYHWDNWAETLKEKTPKMCDCGDKIVWNGDYEGKKVRDLLYSVLSAAHEQKTKQFGRNPFSYQVISVDKRAGGIIAWNVLAL